METRKLGSNFEISAIGLGCMGMTHGFGDASDQKEVLVKQEKFYIMKI